MATKESSNQLYDQRNIVEYVKQFFVPSFLCYLNVDNTFVIFHFANNSVSVMFAVNPTKIDIILLQKHDKVR